MQPHFYYFIALFSSLFFTPPVFAANLGLSAAASRTGLNTASSATLAGTIGSIIGSLLAFVGVLFFILMLYGGITWMLARGNEQYSSRARDTIIAASIGLIIVIGSYAVTNFVFQAATQGASSTPVASPDSVGCCIYTDVSTGEALIIGEIRSRCINDPANNVTAQFIPDERAGIGRTTYCVNRGIGS